VHGAVVCACLGLAAPEFFGVTPGYVPETRWLFVGVGCNFLIILMGLTYEDCSWDINATTL